MRVFTHTFNFKNNEEMNYAASYLEDKFKTVVEVYEFNGDNLYELFFVTNVTLPASTIKAVLKALTPITSTFNNKDDMSLFLFVVDNENCGKMYGKDGWSCFLRLVDQDLDIQLNASTVRIYEEMGGFNIKEEIFTTVGNYGINQALVYSSRFNGPKHGATTIEEIIRHYNY